MPGERQSGYTPPTPEQRDQRTKEVLATLEAQVAAITNDEAFRRYLDVQSRFRSFSYRNTLLILAQDPEATLLKGYRQWQELGRQVRRGSKAIDIFAPLFPPKKDRPDPNVEGDPIGFIPVKVFDIRFTDGPPLPEPPRVPELVGEHGQKEYVAMTLGALEQDFLVWEAEDLPDSRMGHYTPREREIVVARSYAGTPRSQLQRLSTLAHEFAHGLNDHGGPQDLTTQAERETIAQGSSYVALAALGYDNGERTFPYIASFARDIAVLKRVLGTIQRTSRTIVESTEAQLGRLPAIGTAPTEYPVLSASLTYSTMPTSRSIAAGRPHGFSFYLGFQGGEGGPRITPYAPQSPRASGRKNAQA